MIDARAAVAGRDQLRAFRQIGARSPRMVGTSGPRPRSFSPTSRQVRALGDLTMHGLQSGSLQKAMSGDPMALF